MTDRTTDVLVIGSGGGALRAAIEACNAGADVMIATKGMLGKSGATAYQVSEMAGFNCPSGVKDSSDSPEEYYDDMMYAAQGMAVPELVQIVADKAIEAKSRLENWGVGFKKENGQDYAFLSCFSRKARTTVIPGHGEPILNACLRHLQPAVRVIEQTTILSLLVKDEICVGAYVFSKGETYCIWAKSVIVAAGGAGQLFEKNMNPTDITGDGYALGYLAGAELINMEFMQAGIGISHPGVFLLNAYIWGGMPPVTDRNGTSIFVGQLPGNMIEKEILKAHQHHFPFSTSDHSSYFEICIQKAIRDGRGTEHNAVYCDLSHMTDEYVVSCTNQFGLHEMWPVARDYFLSRGLDVKKDRLEISCFAHAINGGLKIDGDGQTNIEGLYAVGESAGGPHGADRLGGNMMLTCQIFGEIAGRAAAMHAKNRVQWDKGRYEFHKEIELADTCLHADIPVIEWRQQIQNLNQSRLLILRNEEGLTVLQDTYEKMENSLLSSKRCPASDIRSAEVYHMLVTSRLMAYAAAQRKESRGSHYREDSPLKLNKFDQPLVIRREHKNG